MQDEQIIRLFWQRSPLAIEQTQEKYGSFCRKIAQNILNNPEDSEECVNDTWLRSWDSIPPQKPAKLSAFLGRITRNLALNRWEKNRAEKRGGGAMDLVLEELDACIPAPGTAEDSLMGKELAKAIRCFLNTLPQREQDIFLRRYFFVEETEVIALRYGMKRATVLRTLSRTREKLKNYLTREGYAL